MKNSVLTGIGILLAVALFLLVFGNFDGILGVFILFALVLIPGLMIYNLVKLDRVEKKLDKLLEEREREREGCP